MCPVYFSLGKTLEKILLDHQAGRTSVQVVSLELGKRHCRNVFLPVATWGPGFCAVKSPHALCWQHCIPRLDQTHRAILC